MLKRLAVDNFILVLQYAANGLLAVLLVPHLVRQVGLEDFGRISVGLAWAGYASVLVQYAFHVTGPKYVAESSSDDEVHQIWLQIVRARGLLFMALLPVVLSILVLVDSSRTSLTLLLCLVPLGAVVHSGWLLQAKNRFGTIGWISASGACVALLVGFFLVGRADVGLSAVSLVIGQLWTAFGTFFVAWKLWGTGSASSTARSVVSALRDGAPLFLSQLVAAIYSLSGPVVVGSLAGHEAAGAFSSIDRVTGAFISAALLTQVAAYPKLAVLRISSHRAYWKLLHLVVLIHAVVAACASLLLWGASERIELYLFGVRSAEHHSLLVATHPRVFIAIFGPVMTSHLVLSARTREILSSTAVALVLTFAAGVPATWYWGAAGWYWGSLVGQMWFALLFVRSWLRAD